MKNKKGFTLIELIIVITIIAILAMLATPYFKGQTAEARLVNIQNDVKVTEGLLEVRLIEEREILTGEKVDQSEIDTALSGGRLYDISGKVPTNQVVGGDFYKLKDNGNSKLPGMFIGNSEGKVYYIHDKVVGDNGNNNGDAVPFIPDGYTLATDSDFQWKEDYPLEGAWHYIGADEYVVVPHIIQGQPVTSYRGMFYSTSVKGVASNNKNIIDMSYMFNKNSATTLDLKNINTSNVTNMSCMFYESWATELDLSAFDTSKVTNMSWMLSYNWATTIDLSSLDTSNVTDMDGMFSYSSAESLDLSNLNTSKVTNMGGMFASSGTKSLDLSAFDTSNVTNMNHMFENSAAVTIDLSSFDTSNVTNMRGIFRDNRATTIDLSSFNTSNVGDMSWMFTNSLVNILDLSNFNTSKVTNMGWMFDGTQAATLDLSSFDTSNVTNMIYMFRDSQATTGYARTQSDADKFNGSSDKPSTLNFIVKP